MSANDQNVEQPSVPPWDGTYSPAELSPQLLNDVPVELTSNLGPYPTIEGQESFATSAAVMGYGRPASERAVRYARNLFQDGQLSILSSDGSSAVLLRDGRGNAYKVYRRSDRYGYIEEEAAKAKILSDLGIGPRPTALVDAALEYRREWPNDTRSFGDVRIPRVESTGRFAVLVTEEVPRALSLQAAGLAVVLREFTRLETLVHGQNFTFDDTEFVYDTDKEKMVIIDAGGLFRLDQEYIAAKMAAYDGYEGLSIDKAAELISLASLASKVTTAFGDGLCSVNDLRPVWETGGVAGISAYLQARLASAQ